MLRTLFVGDVHSCAVELEMLLDAVQPTRVILLGDVFNKGPMPQQTWALIQKWRCEAVLGNHDLAVIGAASTQPPRVPIDALDWLKSLPLLIRGGGWVAVHAGLNPEGETTEIQATRLRRWPDDSSKEHPFWWEVYRGSDLVVYGHDAARGLQDRRPHTLGLDSGCVYGGRLSGYILEEDRLVSVPAQATYRPV